MRMGKWYKFARLFVLSLAITLMAACGTGAESGSKGSGNGSVIYRCTVDENMTKSILSTSYNSNGISQTGAWQFTVGITDGPGDEPCEIIHAQPGMAVKKQLNTFSDTDDSIIAFGPVSDSDRYIMAKAKYDEKSVKLSAEYLNAEGEVLSVTELETDDCLYILPYNGAILTDADGNIHIANMVIQKKNTDYYASFYEIYSPDGKRIKEIPLDVETKVKLFIMPDGTVGADMLTVKDMNRGEAHHKLIKMDMKTGEETVITEYENDGDTQKEQICALNIFDEDRFVYFTGEGVYISDRRFEKTEKVFDWFENGIAEPHPDLYSPKNLVYTDKEGCIYIYLSGSNESYLKLAPSSEDVFVLKIAARNFSDGVLGTAVRRFNSNHPDCRIEVDEGQDKTKLAIELTAGEGPVIIEDFLIDAAEHKDILEPLENLVSGDTIAALNKGGRVCGTIDGTLYGACSAFQLETLVSGADLNDWDYDTFIEYAWNSPNLETITGTTFLEGKTLSTLFLFSLEYKDSYFVNHSKEGEIIDKVKLKKVIDLMDRYQTDTNYEMDAYDMIADKSMLVVRCVVGSPIELYSLKFAIKESGKVIGYPGTNGSKHYLHPVGTFYVRNNATDKEKEYASEFLESLLSYDIQSEVCKSRAGYGLSAREDVLNEQIEDIKSYEGIPTVYGGVMFKYANIDVEATKIAFAKLMEESIPRERVEDSFENIVFEELDEYYTGKIDFETLYDRLNKRIGLIAGEKE